MSISRIYSDERGLSTVEYVIILALIAVAGIGVWTRFGSTVTGKIESSTNRIDKDLATPSGNFGGSAHE